MNECRTCGDVSREASKATGRHIWPHGSDSLRCDGCGKMFVSVERMQQQRAAGIAQGRKLERKAAAHIEALEARVAELERFVENTRVSFDYLLEDELPSPLDQFTAHIVWVLGDVGDARKLSAELVRLRAVCAEVAVELRTLAGVLHESGRGRNACDVETLAKDLDKEAKGGSRE